MKLISWNVNGIRACVQKGFLDFFREADADIFCIQETKMQEGQLELELPGYYQYWNYAVRKGYSGTAIFTKREPLNVRYGIGIEEHDQEGRVITLEYDDLYFVTVYTPNSQNELARLDYRMRWETDFLVYLKKLEEKKPVVFCGDLNVAAEEIDLKNPKTNRKNAGFTDEERDKFRTLKASGFIDTFRYFYPDQEGVYSWWSYRFSARKKNAGWRIDYFVVSEALKGRLKDAKIHTEILGSDHCPVELDMQEFQIAKGFFDTIPIAVDEAALLDGCTRWQIFSRITLPLSKPIIIYTVLTSFMAPWLDFIFAKVICRANSDQYTIAIGLWKMLEKEYIDSWYTSFAAGAVLISIPIAILFLFMQRYYVDGVSGAVKG